LPSPTLLERTSVSAPIRRAWVPIVGVPLLALYYFSYDPNTLIYQYRYFQLTFGFHLLVAFAPFLIENEINAFWQYNRILFGRFWLAVLFSSTLQLGLNTALWGVDHLLGLKIHTNVYADLSAVIGYVFNTWFFVAGVPEDYDEVTKLRLKPSSHGPRSGTRAFVTRRPLRGRN
jgi:hypothetical protein